MSEERTQSGRFKKGVSGNPNGRPKKYGEMQELARAHTELCIKKLADIVKTSRKEAFVIQACEILLERAWGKVTEAKEAPSIDDSVKQIAFETVTANATESSNP